jgi:predicted dehydrogenase
MSINVAQFGVGYWGPNLLRNLFANEDCNVKTVVDLSKKRREFVKNLYPSVEVSNDPDTIINEKNIDAVIIATPVATHYDLIMKCLNAGKHILVEKPMATKVEHVQNIKDLAMRKNLVAMVGHTFLFNSAVRYVKKLISNGELGDVRYIYSQRVNLGRIRSDVDALWNLAPHDISIIQYWLDEPEPLKIQKVGMDYVQSGINDVVFMNIEYPNNSFLLKSFVD